jgi:hypothetical protein
MAQLALARETVDQPARPATLKQVFEAGCIIRKLAPEVCRGVTLAGRDGVAALSRSRIDRLDRHRSKPHQKGEPVMSEKYIVAAILTAAYNANPAKDGPPRSGTLEQRVMEDFFRFLKSLQSYPDLK